MAGTPNKLNLSPEQVESQARRMFVLNGENYRTAWIRCVAAKVKDNWHNLFCKAQVSDEKPGKPKTVRYQELILLEDWLVPEQLLGFIGQEIGELEIAGANVRLRGEFRSIYYEPSVNDYSDLPGLLFPSSSADQFSFSQKPLLTYSQTYYGDPYDAITDWCGIKDFHGSSDARLRSVLVFLPECRASFCNPKYSDGILKISIQGERKALQVKGRWTGPEGVHRISFNAGEEPELVLPKTAETLELYLIDSDDHIYDYHVETSYWSHGQRRILRPTDPGRTTIEALIGQGEGVTLEFKAGVEPTDRQKVEELIRTVIAFSNTKGGDILIGVDDRSQVVGLHRILNRFREKNEASLEGAGDRYIGQLKKLIFDRLNRNPGTQFYMSTANNILRITVPEGREKPYADREKKLVYTRRGASDAIADPDTELCKLCPPGNLGPGV